MLEIKYDDLPLSLLAHPTSNTKSVYAIVGLCKKTVRLYLSDLFKTGYIITSRGNDGVLVLDKQNIGTSDDTDVAHFEKVPQY